LRQPKHLGERRIGGKRPAAVKRKTIGNEGEIHFLWDHLNIVLRKGRGESWQTIYKKVARGKGFGNGLERDDRQPNPPQNRGGSWAPRYKEALEKCGFQKKR